MPYSGRLYHLVDANWYQLLVTLVSGWWVRYGCISTRTMAVLTYLAAVWRLITVRVCGFNYTFAMYYDHAINRSSPDNLPSISLHSIRHWCIFRPLNVSIKCIICQFVWIFSKCPVRQRFNRTEIEIEFLQKRTSPIIECLFNSTFLYMWRLKILFKKWK